MTLFEQRAWIAERAWIEPLLQAFILGVDKTLTVSAEDDGHHHSAVLEETVEFEWQHQHAHAVECVNPQGAILGDSRGAVLILTVEPPDHTNGGSATNEGRAPIGGKALDGGRAPNG